MIALTINHGAKSIAWSGGQANRVVCEEAFDGFFASTLVPFSEARILNCFNKHLGGGNEQSIGQNQYKSYKDWIRVLRMWEEKTSGTQC